MRPATSALSAILSLCLLGSVSGQQRERPEPQWTEVKLDGFLLQGAVSSVVEGDVLTGLDGTTWQPLKPTQQFYSGQVVQVGSSGRAEVLLNPGHYLRLSANTRAALMDLSRENPKVKIFHGSVIIEVLEVSYLYDAYFGPYVPTELLWGIYPPITVVTPQGEFATMKGGIYRFDVGANGATELKVTRGLAAAPGRRAKDGMRATLRDGVSTLTKFDKDSGDAFDDWSRERAASLVRANKSLRDKEWSRQQRKERGSYFRIVDDERAERAKEQFVVSAVEGVVRLAEEGAAYSSGETGWERLSAGIGLKYGDRVRTGEDSRVEIMLYPTCYLHLSSNTEIVYTERPGGGAAVTLRRGSAIVTSHFEGKGHAPVTLAAPPAEYEVAKKGAYRLNILPGGKSEMIVYEGDIKLAAGEINKGEKVVTGGPAAEPLPADKEALDSFDAWSRNRTAPLAAPDKYVRFILTHIRRERNSYGGLWFFDEVTGVYTFVPGRWDFRSPYGGQYKTRFRDYKLPRYFR